VLSLRFQVVLCASVSLWCAVPSFAAAPKAGEVLTAGGLKFAYIPAGQFVMGSATDEKGREEEETPHKVTLGKAFYMGVTEVTQVQWKAVMGQRRGGFEGDALPVEEVSWKDATAFCEKLSAATGRKCRLPTEAEWEYACRAGAAGRFSGSDKLDDLSWFDDNSEEKTHPVGTKKPNAWGLYDMHGNVAEWCADYYAVPYSLKETTDPTGPAQGSARVVRGGSWSSFERGCRCASRMNLNPAHQMKTVGFRVVLEAANPCMEWIEIARDGKGFVRAASGKKFVPWGFNYDRDYRMRLLEDYWDAEWATVAEDFREMKALGANVVRVHPQLAKFMDGPQTPNRKAFEQFGRLVALAEETGLYLDITGLGCFRKRDVPKWYEDATEEQRWAAQACFWEAMAERCERSPAVFFYDLINEPVVPDGKRKPGDWMTGELAGLCYVQFISLDQAGRARAEIARQWVAKMTAAIRKHDRRHLVSVGMLPFGEGDYGFSPKTVAPEVDFLCTHIYPKSGKSGDDLKTLAAFAAAGKPVVIEEMFPINCEAEELGQFIEESRKHVVGWIGFYWGQTPAELKQSKQFGDALMLAWLEMFQKAKPKQE